MKVRKFFEILRRYPDWNVEFLIKDTKSRRLLSIKDIECIDETGDLIILTGEPEQTSREVYIEYLKTWADSHADNIYNTDSPLTYEEWLDNEEV